jgi:lactoylglutathione lyase
MPLLSLNLLTLRAADIEKSLAFYRALGLEFTREQHGTGPIHYASIMRETVIEIFPGKPGNAPDRRNAGATMIGFQVENLDHMVEVLRQQGAEILTPPQESQWGRRAVVEDPDGRAIELSQKRSS